VSYVTKNLLILKLSSGFSIISSDPNSPDNCGTRLDRFRGKGLK